MSVVADCRRLEFSLPVQMLETCMNVKANKAVMLDCLLQTQHECAAVEATISKCLNHVSILMEGSCSLLQEFTDGYRCRVQSVTSRYTNPSCADGGAERVTAASPSPIALDDGATGFVDREECGQKVKTLQNECSRPEKKVWRKTCHAGPVTRAKTHRATKRPGNHFADEEAGAFQQIRSSSDVIQPRLVHGKDRQGEIVTQRNLSLPEKDVNVECKNEIPKEEPQDDLSGVLNTLPPCAVSVDREGCITEDTFLARPRRHQQNVCLICGQLYRNSTLNSLRTHIKEYHGVEWPRYMALFASSFPRAERDLRQLRLESRNRFKVTSPCPKCGKAFSHFDIMVKHLKSMHSSDADLERIIHGLKEEKRLQGLHDTFSDGGDRIVEVPLNRGGIHMEFTGTDAYEEFVSTTEVGQVCAVDVAQDAMTEVCGGVNNLLHTGTQQESDCRDIDSTPAAKITTAMLPTNGYTQAQSQTQPSQTKHHSSSTRQFVCQVCVAEFTYKKSLVSHLSSVHKLKWNDYLLITEGKDVVKKTQSLAELREADAHRCKSKETSKKKPYLCPVCSQSLYSFQSLLRHVEGFHKNYPGKLQVLKELDGKFNNVYRKLEPKLSCPFCAAEKYGRQAIFVHLNLCHQQEKDFGFHVKAMERSVGEAYMFHNKVYNRQRYKQEKKNSMGLTYKCRFCGKEYPWRKSRCRHENFSCVENPDRKPLHHCNRCSFQSQFAEKVQEHIDRQHKRSGASGGGVICKEFLCHICGNGYVRHSGLVTHRREAHDICDRVPKRVYTCSVCNKATNSQAKLKRHLLIHGDKTFLCEVCSKSYHTQQHLKRHFNRIHLGAYRYRCQKCAHGVDKLEYLQKHKCGRVRRNQTERWPPEPPAAEEGRTDGGHTGVVQPAEWSAVGRGATTVLTHGDSDGFLGEPHGIHSAGSGSTSETQHRGLAPTPLAGEPTKPADGDYRVPVALQRGGEDGELACPASSVCELLTGGGGTDVELKPTLESMEEPDEMCSQDEIGIVHQGEGQGQGGGRDVGGDDPGSVGVLAECGREHFHRLSQGLGLSAAAGQHGSLFVVECSAGFGSMDSARGSPVAKSDSVQGPGAGLTSAQLESASTRTSEHDTNIAVPSSTMSDYTGAADTLTATSLPGFTDEALVHVPRISIQQEYGSLSEESAYPSFPIQYSSWPSPQNPQ